MAETPDFDQIARRLSVPGVITGDPEVWIRLIAEQLRLVWNARGAADIVQMESTLFALLDRAVPAASPSTPLVTQLDRALRTLDR